MTNRRKQLKEEIARTDDPLVQLQLRDLLVRKRQREEKWITRLEEALDSLLRQAIVRLPARATFVFAFIIITVILVIVLLILGG